MPAKTLIRKDQIRIDEFIQAVSNVDWTSDSLSASAAAIAAKIQSEVVGVTGAMLYRGSWNSASSDIIKKGYVYVYDGTGTAPTGVTLENGDTLIAKQDDASVTNSNHWTIVQVNITGAVTENNLLNILHNYLGTGNSNALSFSISNGKFIITANFPTVSNGTSQSGYYVSGISIDPQTGVITVSKAALPSQLDWGSLIHLDEICDGSVNGVNKVFSTQSPAKEYNGTSVAFFINGVKQTNGNDYTFSIDSSSGKGVFTITSGYVPKSGDVVSCSYIELA